jgi:hypothetical protein
MKPRFSIPTIPEAERTPLVTMLLGLIEALAERVQKQEEEIAHLKDEVRVLKGEKKRPRFKPSKMDEETDKPQSDAEGSKEDPRRPGSEKRSKTAELVIHDEQIIQPSRRIPKGSRFKGYREVVIQDLLIRAHRPPSVRYDTSRRWPWRRKSVANGTLIVAIEGTETPTQEPCGPELTSQLRDVIRGGIWEPGGSGLTLVSRFSRETIRRCSSLLLDRLSLLGPPKRRRSRRR